MADYGIKISIAGYNVLTADARYMSLNSGQNIFKVFASGSTTVASGATTEITHSLGYIPNFYVYLEDDANGNTMSLVSASLLANTAQAYADTSKVYVYNTGATTRTVFYYIMYDPTS